MTDDTRILPPEEVQRMISLIGWGGDADDTDRLFAHDRALRAALAATKRELGQWDERHRAWQDALAAAEERAEQAEHDHGNLNADRICAEAERDQAIRERQEMADTIEPLVAQVRTLREFVQHKDDCHIQDVWAGVYPSICTCGLDAALGEKNDAD